MNEEEIIKNISKLMKEMAHAPKENFGKKEPIERNLYERQRRESHLGSEVYK